MTHRQQRKQPLKQGVVQAHLKTLHGHGKRLLWEK